MKRNWRCLHLCSFLFLCSANGAPGCPGERARAGKEHATVHGHLHSLSCSRTQRTFSTSPTTRKDWLPGDESFDLCFFFRFRGWTFSKRLSSEFARAGWSTTSASSYAWPPARRPWWRRASGGTTKTCWRHYRLLLLTINILSEFNIMFFE